MAVMRRELVAPCGMNCNLCSWVLDPSKPGCVGCRPRGRGCIHKKGLCKKLAEQKIDFCYRCENFPCGSLLLIEDRYNRAHNYSFIENLKYIKKCGMPAFLLREAKRYTCKKCGKFLTIHNDKCPHCGVIYKQDHRR
jgi:ribosomal protein S27AE